MNVLILFTLVVVLVLATGTAVISDTEQPITFGGDLAFLGQHTDVVVLSESAGDARVVVSPALQGRVLTSTAGGSAGISFGWINRELIASGKTVEHTNAYGGEDRFWIGPEGGQFSVFFKKNAPFDFENWFTPAPIDTEPFELVSSCSDRAVLQKKMPLENYSGTVFDLTVDREIHVLERNEAGDNLGMIPAVPIQMVCYESINQITNSGLQAWEKSTGLLSIWVLGMYNPSPTTIVIVPFVGGSVDELGPVVNDAYFGKIPADRLQIKDGVLFFKADGRQRSKIGLSPQRARSVFGSFDAANNVLTIVQYSKPQLATDYVNSMWQFQEHPYRGDTINSYNDGPMTPGGKPLGPFYELETSSPAAALQPGQTIRHIHRTYHLQGDEKQIDAVANSALGVSVAQIKSSFTR